MKGKGDIIFARVLKISLSNYLPAEKTAIFRVDFEDFKGRAEFSKEMPLTQDAVEKVRELLIMSAARRHYSADSKGNVNVIIENEAAFINAMNELLARAQRMIQIIERKDAKSYLNALSNINMLSIELGGER